MSKTVNHPLEDAGTEPAFIDQSLENAGIDTAFLDSLFANRDRIASNGDDPSSDAFWHRNALMVVAGVLGAAGKAGAACSQASMVLAAAITDTFSSGRVQLSLDHAGGSTATVDIAVSPAGQPLPHVAPVAHAQSSEPERCIWVTLSSLRPASFASLVKQLSDQAGLRPGSMEMDIATGAVLALVQACDASHACDFSSRLEGFGDSERRLNVSVTASVRHPQPQPAPTRPALR